MKAKKSTYSSMNKEMIRIADYYFEAKRNQSQFGLMEDDMEYSPYQNYISRVHQAYDSLSTLEKNIINNEFFLESYPNWWDKTYGKAAFKLYKTRAMSHFLEAFRNVGF